jgi:hypothetical protein
MVLDTFQPLIKNLPVRDQCFTTNRNNAKWQLAERDNEKFQSLNNNLFSNKSDLTISRRDIFEINSEPDKIFEFIIKVIYWGYPKGMQGNNFSKVIEQKNIEKLSSILSQFQKQKVVTKQDYFHLIQEFKQIKGISLSTYSKFLYFLEVSIDNLPCLILDRRIIKTIADKKFEDFFSIPNIYYGINAERQYINYLEIINNLAVSLETKGENIELFLFLFGNNLKSVDF